MTEAERISGIELSLIRQIIQQASPTAINLALGELRFGFPNEYREFLSNLFRSETPYYTPNAGLPELREAVAAYYGTEASQVCITNGVEEALYSVFTAFVNAGDLVAVLDPEYPAYRVIANMMQAKVVVLPYEADLKSINWDKWDKLLNGAKFMVLSNPKNPTGQYFCQNDMYKLTSLCKKHETYLIVDEIYRDLYLQERPDTFYGKYEHLFILSGLSKSHAMSGLRLGWVISPPELSNSLIKTYQYLATCANWTAQKLASFTFSPIGEHVNMNIRQQLQICHEIIKHELIPYLSSEDHILSDASPYFMFKCDGDDLIVAKTLASEGVIVVPGRAFGEMSKNWIRINYALMPDILKAAISLLLK